MAKCQTKCSAKELLKQSNLKSTKQRVIVLEKIIDLQSIFSATSLFAKLEDSVDQATVYRILSSFKESGIIRDVIGKDEIKRYEIACTHNPVHPHLFCTKCEKIICLESIDNNIVNFLKDSNTDIQIDEVHIQFTGVCHSCRS